MLTVVDIQTIVHLYRSGDYSRRGIARKLGISRTTVDKVLAQYEATQETSDNEALDNLLTLQPAYNSRGRKPRKLCRSIAAEIDRYLELNAQRRHQGMRKQQLKKIDIWQILSGQGIQISYPSVCRYVTNKEKAGRPGETKAYVRQAYAPGEECEFDWGEVRITIGAYSANCIWPCSPPVMAICAGHGCSRARTRWPSWSRTAISSVRYRVFHALWSMTICAWLSRSSWVPTRRLRPRL